MTASDGTHTVTQDVTVTIRADDDAATANAGNDASVNENATYRLCGSGSDPEGQALTYQWTQLDGPAVTLSNAHAAQPTFRAPELLENATATFQLAVSDGVNTTYDTVTITIRADDDAPSANAGANITAPEKSSVTLHGSGVDPEQQDVTFAWRQVSGPPVTLDDPTSPNPTFTTPDLTHTQQIVFELDVSDGVNITTDSVTITVAAVNDVPIADAGANGEVQEMQTYTLHGAGSDPEGTAVTFTWTQISGPPVELDDPHAASPSFTAPNLVGDSDVVFQLAVSDGVNTTLDTVTVTIRAENDAVTADAGADGEVEETNTYTLQGFGVDPENQALSYSWTQVSGPPVDLDDPHAAAPSFTSPNLLSDTDVIFELTVSDGVHTATDSVTITIRADNDAPTADAGADGEVQEMHTYTLQGSGVDPENQSLSYTWTQVSGPPVELDNPHAAAPSFTAPNLLSDGDVVFRLAVSDGVNTTTDTVTITVLAENQAPTDLTHTGGSVAQMAAPGTLVASMTAHDPDTDETFTWRLADDADGRFTIDSNGNVTLAPGGPPLNAFTTPVHEITVIATDSAGHEIDRTITITVAPAPMVSTPQPNEPDKQPADSGPDAQWSESDADVLQQAREQLDALAQEVDESVMDQAIFHRTADSSADAIAESATPREAIEFARSATERVEFSAQWTPLTGTEQFDPGHPMAELNPAHDAFRRGDHLEEAAGRESGAAPRSAGDEFGAEPEEEDSAPARSGPMVLLHAIWGLVRGSGAGMRDAAGDAAAAVRRENRR